MFNVLKTKKTLDTLLVREKTENRAFMAAIQIQNLLIFPQQQAQETWEQDVNRCAAGRPFFLAHLLLPEAYTWSRRPPPWAYIQVCGKPSGQRLTRPKCGILLGSRRVGSCSLVARQ